MRTELLRFTRARAVSDDAAAAKKVEILSETKRSSVFAVKCANDQTYVIKQTYIAGAKGRDMYHKEARILKQLRSDPGILYMYKTFKENEWGYIVTEKGSHDLFLEAGEATEQRARHCVRCVLTTLGRLHAMEIAHGDLKLENVLVMQDGRIVLADMQFVQEGEDATNCTALQGTLHYLAPEVYSDRSSVSNQSYWSFMGYSREYDAFKADVWALGVLAHSLLSNEYPYTVKKLQRMADKKVRLPHRPVEDVSDECKDFIRLALTMDLDERPTAAQLLRHRWLRPGVVL